MSLAGCDLFTPMPTDNGICHTFNGLELKKIFKPTNWVNSFGKSFGEKRSEEPLKSEGIDLDEGFVFTLDTLQSYFVTMKERVMEQGNFNRFWIKVHSAGEIPWIKKDKSSWKKIESYKDEISTRFITIKGEKITNKVLIIILPWTLMKFIHF